MAEAVLFDFGGTLDADGRPWCERLHAGYRAIGGQLGYSGFEQRFRLATRSLARRPEVIGFGFRELVEAQMQALLELLPDRRMLEPGGWSDRFIGNAQNAAARNRFVLDALARRFELAVVSNFSGNLRPCLAELGLEDCFELVFDSAVVGIRKPDLRLFHAAFDALGRRAEECWMVGDNPFSDIEPASRLGCATCWLAPAERPLPPGLKPTERIAALDELPSRLA